MADVFISYARSDLDRAKPIAEALEAHGLEVWWDQTSLRTGQPFNQAIQNALSQVRVVIVLWSENSLKSDWVQAEAYWAWENGKLISILLDDGIKLPVPFNTIHAENLFGWSGDTSAPAFQNFITDLTKTLEDPSDGMQLAIDARPDDYSRSEGKKGGSRKGSKSKAWIRAIASSAIIFLVVAFLFMQEHFFGNESEQAEVQGQQYVTGEVVRDTLKGGLDGPEMVYVKGGEFEMGFLPYEDGYFLDEESPRHRVTIKPFFVSKYEVTFQEYEDFVESTKRKLPDDRGWKFGKRPVINVSWDDALAYTEWLSKGTGKRYRLPSEAEWEYAARAGTDTDFWWGNDIRQDDIVRANCRGCGSQWDSKQAAPVGSFKPNVFGLHDTAGNVAEWVQDCWHDSYEGTNRPDDGSAWETTVGDTCEQRIVRGGSWSDEGKGRLRSTARESLHFNSRVSTVGFRIARDVH